MNGWWWNWYRGSGWPAIASFQPPAYQAQLTFLSFRRSPMLGRPWLGSSEAAAVVAGCGWLTLNVVLTAKPSGVTEPSWVMTPLASSLATALAGALKNDGAQAQIRKKWLRNDPPNAAWKKLSSITYCCASLPSGRLVAS